MEDEIKDETKTTDQGDGATGATLTNEDAQALVDSGAATPGEEAPKAEETDGAPV